MTTVSIEDAQAKLADLIWKQTEGAWQGELVREAQEEYPTRLEIE